MEIDFFNLLILAFVIAALMMLLVWWIAMRIKNAGIVDIAWAGNFTLLAVVYAVLGSGYRPRKALAVAMMTAWSLRLTLHLYRRVMGHHPVEDGRYQQLRREWASSLPVKFFWFFQFQGCLNVVLSVPVLLACLNAEPQIHVLEWLALGTSITALLGEWAADSQLARFKSNPANAGKVCQAGLWNYSRHPNYFFEWLIWVSYFLLVLPSPYGFATIYCPLLMLYFLFRVTGIPMTEEQAIRSKGDVYREYQRTTSAFVPWMKKVIRDA